MFSVKKQAAEEKYGDSMTPFIQSSRVQIKQYSIQGLKVYMIKPYKEKQGLR